MILQLCCSAVHTDDFHNVLHYCLFPVPTPLGSLSLIWGLSHQSRTVKYYGGRDCTIIGMVDCLFCKKFVVVHVFRSLTLGTIFVNGFMFSSHSSQQSYSVIHFCDLVKVALVRPRILVKIKLSRAYRVLKFICSFWCSLFSSRHDFTFNGISKFVLLFCSCLLGNVTICVTLSYFGDSCFMKFYAHAT